MKKLHFKLTIFVAILITIFAFAKITLFADESPRVNTSLLGNKQGDAYLQGQYDDAYILGKENSQRIEDIYRQKLRDKKEKKDLSISAYILSSDQSITSDTISDIRIQFHIANLSEKNYPLLRIKTGIKEGVLNYVRLQGASGYKWVDGELEIAYVSLPAGSETDVIITALPLITSDEIILSLSPIVQGNDNTVLTSGDSMQKNIRGKRKDLVEKFTFVEYKTTEVKIQTEPNLSPVVQKENSLSLPSKEIEIISIPLTSDNSQTNKTSGDLGGSDIEGEKLPSSSSNTPSSNNAESSEVSPIEPIGE